MKKPVKIPRELRLARKLSNAVNKELVMLNRLIDYDELIDKFLDWYHGGKQDITRIIADLEALRGQVQRDEMRST